MESCRADILHAVAQLVVFGQRDEIWWNMENGLAKGQPGAPYQDPAVDRE